MRCDVCCYWSRTTYWSYYWRAYLCDYCVDDLDWEEYQYLYLNWRP